jgi:16S rRNA (guanine527-N7)-methyltransferase
MTTDETGELIRGAHELGIDLDDTTAQKLIMYLDKLDSANRRFNITRISRADALFLHLLDSLTALCIPLDKAPASILDIGTGGGFPGVPLAALVPTARVTLLDSTLKKVTFAHESAQHCGIHNTQPVHARAEVYAKLPCAKASFDLVVSRAVAECKTLFKWMLPFVRSGGTAIALKGSNVEDELRGTAAILDKNSADITNIQRVILPNTDIERFLVVIKKT